MSSSVRDARLKLYDPKAMLLLGVNESAGLLGPFGVSVPIGNAHEGQPGVGHNGRRASGTTDRSEDTKRAIKEAMGDNNGTVRAAALRSAALLDLRAYYTDIAALLR